MLTTGPGRLRNENINNFELGNEYQLESSLCLIAIEKPEQDAKLSRVTAGVVFLI